MVIEYRCRGNMIIPFQYFYKNLLLYFLTNLPHVFKAEIHFKPEPLQQPNTCSYKEVSICIKEMVKKKKNTVSPTGSRTRAAWVKTRNPNCQIIWDFVVCVIRQYYYFYALLVCQCWKVHNFYQFFFFQLNFTRVSPQESAFLHTHSARHSGSAFFTLYRN